MAVRTLVLRRPRLVDLGRLKARILPPSLFNVNHLSARIFSVDRFKIGALVAFGRV